jgi:murein DD-endopeptidase MepM/ murein hydrolase activator NlpD
MNLFKINKPWLESFWWTEVTSSYGTGLPGSLNCTKITELPDMIHVSTPMPAPLGEYYPLADSFGPGRDVLPAPYPGGWYFIDVTKLYPEILESGILFRPVYNEPAKVNQFHSSDVDVIDNRPALIVEYDECSYPVIPPNFKLPLPGGFRWCVTMEIGGGDALDPQLVDEYHTNTSAPGNYFSIDFSWRRALPDGTRVEVESDRIPVLAAADGWVIVANNNDAHANGCYVVIDHDGDKNVNTGYTTRYLHLTKEVVPVLPLIDSSIGLGTPVYVHQGDVIGYMGNTGPYSKGKHLHFGVRYSNQGYSHTPELQIVRFDGKHMKQYQTEGSSGVRHINSFFGSNNVCRPLSYVFPVIGQ